MKKAFYLLGAIYFGYKLADIVHVGIRDGIDYYREITKPKLDRIVNGTKKQPIGFAVERIES